MAKEQKRGNRETKKPKKNKETVAAPASVIKGMSTPVALPKKKA